jgi:hypothetical protein
MEEVVDGADTADTGVTSRRQRTRLEANSSPTKAVGSPPGGDRET